ncbi:PAS domain S-box protein [Geobacter benzoatilyticus]|uniref:histidine kinase n=1 Tax=Geobacter benzoatilyticus TaxID=2815309 RepID=A0ABX7Q4H4_9BACT|nr:PAS domain S-box protein [Geobacter benzoatilyticus]QSV45796.1 PAS domain S-box protein [Geobacter benzoatilyticus]
MKLPRSIRTKVWLCVLVAFVGYLVATLSSYYSNFHFSQNLDHLRRVDFPLALKGGEVLNRYRKQLRLYEDAFVTGERDYALRANETGREIVTDLAWMVELSREHADHRYGDVHGLKSHYEAYFREASALYPRAVGGADALLNVEIARLGADGRSILVDFERVARGYISSVEYEIQRNRELARDTSLYLFVLFGTVVLLAVPAITFVANRLLIRPLDELRGMVTSFARGTLDLSTLSPSDDSDEIGSLKASFRAMVEGFRETTVSRDYVDNIIDSMSDFLVVVDTEASIHRVNRAALAMLGYDEEQLLGGQVGFLFARERDKECLRTQGLKEFVASIGMSPVEFTFQSRDGHRIPVLLSLSPMFNPDGSFQGTVFVAVDISERKRAEQTLRESEQHLKNILDSIHAGILVIDPETHTIVDANSFALAMIGAPKGLVVDRVCHKFVCVAAQGACPITDLREEIDNSERQLLRYDGTSIPILKSAVPVNYLGKKLLIESFIDISERKWAEEMLRYLTEGTASVTGEEFFRSLVRRLSSALGTRFASVTRIMGDSPRRIRTLAFWTGNGYCANLEMPLEGTPCGRVTNDGDVLFHAGNFGSIYPGAEILNRMCVESFLGVPLLDSRGNTVGHLAVMDDKPMGDDESHRFLLRIFAVRAGAELERMRADEALRESEARYKDLFENATDLIQSVSPSGEILYVNRAWRETLGYSEQEVKGMTIDRIIHPESLAHCMCEFRRIMEGESLEGVETRFVAKDGRSILVEGSINCNIVDGNPKASRGIFRDITERRQHEDTLRKYATELEQINEDLKDFAYIVSHDLRAPLVSIKGFSHELSAAVDELKGIVAALAPTIDLASRERIQRIFEQDIDEAVGFINSSSQRMDTLITAILNQSRLGRRELHAELVDMGAIVRSILNSLAHQIETSRAMVEIGTLPVITADRLAMEQIMGNLLDNALKYLEAGREGRLHVWSEESGEECLFHVRDNGRGIRAEDIPRVFELFRRAGRQDVPGEGMGLACVKTLVRRLGGRIWCESEIGAGSTFSFALPSAKQSPNCGLVCERQGIPACSPAAGMLPL